jgi:hypothetical protein
MGESWMVDGETPVMMMAMIFSNTSYLQFTPLKRKGQSIANRKELAYSVLGL